MKKILAFLLKPLVVGLIVFIFYYFFSIHLDKEIDKLYKKNELYVNHINGLAEKDKGNILIEKSLSKENMLILGSSEFSSPVPENLKNLFPNNLYNGDISLVGHAYVQNALHAMNLGANYKYLKNNDIMIVESLQWFTGEEVNIDGFLSNFSELQFYQFLNNNKISKKNKNYLCNRYMQIENKNITNLKETKIGKYLPYQINYGQIINKQTYVLAKLYSSNDLIDKLFYQISKPYYWLRYKVLELKDKYFAYNWLKSLNSSSNDEIVEIDWDKIYANAKKEGKEAATNNDLYVYDEYYTTYLKDTYNDIKGISSKVKLLESNEWGDFKFFLSVCDELGIKPYITVMSTNGLYYDYVGITKDKRDKYYDKIETLANTNGFNVLNLKDFEYTPYFYCDVMHLGWKGWPYVIQNTIEHFSKQEN